MTSVNTNISVNSVFLKNSIADFNIIYHHDAIFARGKTFPTIIFEGSTMCDQNGKRKV